MQDFEMKLVVDPTVNRSSTPSFQDHSDEEVDSSSASRGGPKTDATTQDPNTDVAGCRALQVFKTPEVILGIEDKMNESATNSSTKDPINFVLLLQQDEEKTPQADSTDPKELISELHKKLKANRITKRIRSAEAKKLKALYKRQMRQQLVCKKNAWKTYNASSTEQLTTNENKTGVIISNTTPKHTGPESILEAIHCLILELKKYFDKSDNFFSAIAWIYNCLNEARHSLEVYIDDWINKIPLSLEFKAGFKYGMTVVLQFCLSFTCTFVMLSIFSWMYVLISQKKE